MKGRLPAGRYDVRWQSTTRRQPMKKQAKVTQIGLDVHRKFSIAAGRDASHKVLWRERLDHVDRNALSKQLSRWPGQTPVILEGTFGWGWMSDELSAAGLDPHLASSRKVAGWRDTRGLAKSNKIDADLLSELWDQKPRWWEVWLAPQDVRDRRGPLRHRMSLGRVAAGGKKPLPALLAPRRNGHKFSGPFKGAGGGFPSLLGSAQE